MLCLIYFMPFLFPKDIMLSDSFINFLAYLCLLVFISKTTQPVSQHERGKPQHWIG